MWNGLCWFVIELLMNFLDQRLCLKCLAFKGTAAAAMTRSAQSHTKAVELEAEDGNTSGTVTEDTNISWVLLLLSVSGSCTSCVSVSICNFMAIFLSLNHLGLKCIFLCFRKYDFWSQLGTLGSTLVGMICVWFTTTLALQKALCSPHCMKQ